MRSPRRRRAEMTRRLAAPMLVALATVAGSAYAAWHHVEGTAAGTADRTRSPGVTTPVPAAPDHAATPAPAVRSTPATVPGMAPPGSAGAGTMEPSAAAELMPPNSSLVFAEDFNGPAGAPADPSRWTAVTGGDGFGNAELECNTDDRRFSRLDGAGDLVMTAAYLPGYQCDDGNVNDFASARLSTSGLASATYGRLRVRAKLPTASGVWPGIWALGQDIDTDGWPWCGEIDLAEVVGKTPASVYQSLHMPGRDDKPYATSRKTDLGRPVSDAFHVYGFDWSPNEIDFSIDGSVTARFTRAEIETHGTWVFDKPFFLLLDVAVGGSFPGPPEDTGAYPQSMVVDYVHLYN